MLILDILFGLFFFFSFLNTERVVAAPIAQGILSCRAEVDVLLPWPLIRPNSSFGTKETKKR